MQNNGLKTGLLVVLGLVAGIVVGYFIANRTPLNNGDNYHPKVSEDMGTVILGNLGIKFDYPSNFVNRDSFTPEKVGEGYIMANDFVMMGRDTIGDFVYSQPGFSYAAPSDNFVDAGGEDECPRRNITTETLNPHGTQIIYNYGGEIQSCYEGDGLWYEDPLYAKGVIQVDGTYNGVHFSELVIYNRNLDEKDFRKILESVRPI